MFYNTNENRAYPFDEYATLKADDGRWLPTHILSDLSVTIPLGIARRVFAAAISRTPSQTTIVLAADNADRTPLAMVAYPADYLPRTRYSLKPLVPDVTGSFIPGERIGEDATYNLRFSEPSQSYLLARTVFAVDSVVDRDYSVFYSGRSLQGLVRLIAGGDIQLEIKPRLLNGQVRQAIVLRLQSLAGATTNVLSDYAANLPRPENRSCGDPQPVETINRIKPDCCGRVFLELRGCSQPVRLLNTCGVVLDCPHDANSLCADRTNFDPGPDQQNDLCTESGSIDPLTPPSNQPVIPPWWSADI